MDNVQYISIFRIEKFRAKVFGQFGVLNICVQTWIIFAYFIQLMILFVEIISDLQPNEDAMSRERIPQQQQAVLDSQARPSPRPSLRPRGPRPVSLGPQGFFLLIYEEPKHFKG